MAKARSAPKRRGKKKQTLFDGSDVTVEQKGAPEPGSGAQVFVGELGGPDQLVDPGVGAINIPMPDGNIEIQLGGQDEEPQEPDTFGDNLADRIDRDDPMTLWRVSTTLLDAIDSDIQNYSGWLQERSDGLELLAMKVEKPGTGGVGQSSTAVSGQSTVRDSLLAEAVDTFQANAFGELCPSAGPVKVTNYGDETPENDQLASDLETDLNFYLTGGGPGTAKEYYPDTRRMLWWTGYSSGMFKKVYACPLRRRPVSESVDGSNLIMPSNATDLQNAGRITHRIEMRGSVLKRMQLIGSYRNVPLTQPVPVANPLQAKEALITGLAAIPQRIEDQEYTIYEVYCELDLPGYEHKDAQGNETGLPLPYRVVIDKDSRVVLAIHRNWEEDDEDQMAKIPFVAFPYTDNMGIYGTGLLQRLGNYAMALTMMLRESIDAGMFANFPGFLFAKPAGRQLQSEFRVPPGGGAPIDVSATGNNINNAVMPLPYKDVSQASVALMAQVREVAVQYAGMANQGVAEGRQDAPVGTTLAMIEQSTKIVGAVHKALHNAQKEEFGLLKELFRADPDALWRGNRRPALGPNEQVRKQRFVQALENCELVPASDPNVPSQMHRLGKANALLQVVQQAPMLFNLPAVFQRWAAMMKIEDIQSLLAPPQPPGQQPDPAMLQYQAKMAELQQRQAQFAGTMQLKQKQLQQTADLGTMKLAAQHSANMSRMGSAGQADPMEHAQLALKHRELGLKHYQLESDNYNQHLDRENQQTIKAMDMAARLATHPEAQPEINSELAGLGNFLTPIHGEGAGINVQPRPQGEGAAQPPTQANRTMQQLPPTQEPGGPFAHGGEVHRRVPGNASHEITAHAPLIDPDVLAQIEQAFQLAQGLSGHVH